MADRRVKRIVGLGLLSVAAMVFAGASVAQLSDGGDGAIVIRRTVPYPTAVERRPLTSDQLNTSTTRLIDARRGLRPYRSVFHGRHGGYDTPLFVGHDDTFGISRAEDRPYGVSQRTPRTFVSRYENPSLQRRDRPSQRADRSAVRWSPIVIVDKRDAASKPAEAKRPMRVVIHQDTPLLPSNSGAVLIASDGTVIQVGD